MDIIVNMINYFLNQQQGGITSQKRKIIQKKILSRRKYNPFHLKCQYTKKQLCYCKKNPICYLSNAQKIELWTNSYAKQYQFYNDQQVASESNLESKKKNSSLKFDSHAQINESEKDTKQSKQKKLLDEAKRQFNVCVEKIRGLSRQQVTSFVKQYSKNYRNTEIDTAHQVPNMF